MRRSVVFWIGGVVMLLVPSMASAKKKTVPLAKGEYRITLEDKRIGQEKFSIYRKKQGHHRITNHTFLAGAHAPRLPFRSRFRFSTEKARNDGFAE